MIATRPSAHINSRSRPSKLLKSPLCERANASIAVAALASSCFSVATVSWTSLPLLRCAPTGNSRCTEAVTASQGRTVPEARSGRAPLRWNGGTPDLRRFLRRLHASVLALVTPSEAFERSHGLLFHPHQALRWIVRRERFPAANFSERDLPPAWVRDWSEPVMSSTSRRSDCIRKTRPR